MGSPNIDFRFWISEALSRFDLFIVVVYEKQSFAIHIDVYIIALTHNFGWYYRCLSYHQSAVLPIFVQLDVTYDCLLRMGR